MSYVQVPEVYWKYFLNADRTGLFREKIERFYDAIYESDIKYDIIRIKVGRYYRPTQAYFNWELIFNWDTQFNGGSIGRIHTNMFGQQTMETESFYVNTLSIVYYRPEENYETRDINLGDFKIQFKKTYLGNKLYIIYNPYPPENTIWYQNQYKGPKQKEFLDSCMKILRTWSLEEKRAARLVEDQRIATELVVSEVTNKTIPSIGHRIMEFAGFRLPGTFPALPAVGQDYPSVLRRLHEARQAAIQERKRRRFR